MNWVDAAVVLLLALAAYAGWCLRGLVLLAVAACLAAAPWCADWGRRWLGPWLDARIHATLNGYEAAYWLCLLLCVLLLLLFFRILAGIFKTLKLSWLDQGLGALLVAGLAFVFLSVFFMRVLPRYSAPRADQTLRRSWFCREAFPPVPPRVPELERLFARLFDAESSPAPEPRIPALRAPRRPPRHPAPRPRRAARLPRA